MESTFFQTYVMPPIIGILVGTISTLITIFIKAKIEKRNIKLQYKYRLADRSIQALVNTVTLINKIIFILSNKKESSAELLDKYILANQELEAEVPFLPRILKADIRTIAVDYLNLFKNPYDKRTEILDTMGQRFRDLKKRIDHYISNEIPE